jgi:hypothetical protein
VIRSTYGTEKKEEGVILYINYNLKGEAIARCIPSLAAKA